MNTVLVLYAFGAGMVATVNPCGFAMLPAYVSYYLATGKDDPGPAGLIPRLGNALLVSGALTTGFVALFAAAGVAVSLGAYFLIQAVPWIGLLIGAGLVLLGGWLLLGQRLVLPGLPQLYARPERSLRNIFLFGVAYGLISLSCTLPIFLGTVGSVFASGGIIAGLTQFLAYGLGMGAVIIALTLGLALFEEVLVDRLRRLIPYVERAGAVLLLAAGVYIIYYWLTKGLIPQAIG
ncbi:MAG TPA: cytochrome c biogenesis protein CcdA [Caldilineae bacterium]|nr:cytochrome c biogenesis protein CcdA [Caldilineae bacterium]